VCQSRYLSVYEEEWPELADPWDVVRRRGDDAVAVLPITPANDVIFVRQFRAAARKHVLEIPAGLLDQVGESREECIARELREETGFEHTSLVELCEIYPSPGSWTERVYLFIADTASTPREQPEHGIEVILRPFGEAVAQARDGEIEDAKTALALLLADARRDRG
jgi:ADP-ribose pyrophosphatase